MGFVVGVVDGRFDDALSLMEHFFVEPDARRAVDPLNDEVDFTQSLGGGANVLFLESLQIEALQIIVFSSMLRRVESLLAPLFVEALQPVGFEQMVDPFTPFATEIEGLIPLLLGDHHRFIKLKPTMGTGDKCQRGLRLGK